MANHPADNRPEPGPDLVPRPLGLYDPRQRDRTEGTRSSPKEEEEEAILANDKPVPTPRQLAHFEQVILPHLDSAYNLARWLTGNDHDAEDVVQDAYLRVLEFFSGFRGGDGRPWLLAIVRHVCYDRLGRQRSQPPLTVFDEELHQRDEQTDTAQLVLKQADRG